MDQKRLLKVDKLRVVFQQKEGVSTTAVDQISFEIKRGQTLGVVGESGSGKSVTALSILQLLSDDPSIRKEGDILFYDKNQKEIALHRLSASELNQFRGKRISMIFQEPKTALNPVLKVGHQILEAILLHTDSKQQTAKEQTLEWLKKVNLSDTERVFNSYPHQLSGGQLQRIMIAMAMSGEPDLLIADEPTTGLDVTVQKEILQLMHELQKETNCSIFFISHDLGVIREIADEVLVMQNGKIVEKGLVKALFEAPKHPYTRGLIACRPPLDKRLKRLPVISDFFSNEMPSTTYATESISKKESKKPPLLKVDDLQVHFSTGGQFFKKIMGRPLSVTKAVAGVSFEVFQGETIGLVGESGCGKTTLGKAILQLIPPNDGRVQYDSIDVFSLDKHALKAWRKKVQIIFQDPYSSLNPSMTIGHAIREVLKVHGIHQKDNPKEKTLQLLKDVGLEPKHYDRFPDQLSGGQRQRVCIARALAVEPEFIVCDEPVSALDVSVQAQVLNLLKDLQEKYGFTYLFISHDFSVIRFMCDRLLVMNKGKIIESGYTDEVLDAPRQAFTRKLLEAVI